MHFLEIEITAGKQWFSASLRQKENCFEKNFKPN